MDISVVIPLFNEEVLVEELLERISQTLDRTGLSSEIITVNDGSSDNTLDRLKRAIRRYPNLRIVDLSRNFGHQPALMAGLQISKGRAVIMIDGDLQDPPEIFPDLIEKWKKGSQVIIAARKERKEGFIRRLLFHTFYRFFTFMSDYPMPFDSGIFGLLDRKAVDQLLIMEERNRFIPGLRSWVGFKNDVVWYIREDRAKGKPKQSWFRLLRYAADAIFSFSYKPLRISLFFGLFVSFISFAYGITLVTMRLLKLNYVEGFTTAPVAIFFLGGIILISIGILGEYLARIYDEVKRRPLFIINEIIEKKSSR